MSQTTTANSQHVRICGELLEYVLGMRFNNYEGAIDYDTPLLNLGIVDSLSMMRFILFLERKYGLDFFVVDIGRADFASINVLAGLIARNLPAERSGTEAPSPQAADRAASSSSGA